MYGKNRENVLNTQLSDGLYRVYRIYYFYPKIPQREILIENLMIFNFVKHTIAVKLDLGKL